MVDPERVAAAVTERTRAICLPTPGNPTGVVLGRDELERLAAICRERGLYFICDEEPRMSILKNWALLCVVACTCVVLGQDAQEARLMRFPDIYKDKVVFMYGGDLWLASTSGGKRRQFSTPLSVGRYRGDSADWS